MADQDNWLEGQRFSASPDASRFFCSMMDAHWFHVWTTLQGTDTETCGETLWTHVKTRQQIDTASAWRAHQDGWKPHRDGSWQSPDHPGMWADTTHINLHYGPSEDPHA